MHINLIHFTTTWIQYNLDLCVVMPPHSILPCSGTAYFSRQFMQRAIKCGYQHLRLQLMVRL